MPRVLQVEGKDPDGPGRFTATYTYSERDFAAMYSEEFRAAMQRGEVITMPGDDRMWPLRFSEPARRSRQAGTAE